MSSITCPKCGYARKPEDAAPEWQCPACGVAYKKFRDAAAAREGDAASSKGAIVDLRERTLLSAGRGDQSGGTALITYGLLLFTFLWFPAYTESMRLMSWLPPLMVVSSFYFWLGAYRRLKMVADVPTSTVAAAAQGYVELIGTAAHATGDSLVGHLTRVPCVWYRYEWHRASDKTGDVGERGVPFILRDATGDCVIDPAGAEAICDRCQTWIGEGAYFREWSIRVGDPVYAIGHFSSGGAAEKRQVDLRTAYALAALERKPEEYAARFDADGDGKVDRREATLARADKRREILGEVARSGGVHTLGASPDGRPFLIIGADHEKVVSRYRLLTVAHLAVFVASLGAAAFVWI